MTLTIKLPESDFTLEHDDATDIRHLLDATSHRVRSACRGIGACGICKIKTLRGAFSDPSDVERLQLSGDELRRGVRLACQTRCRGDAVIEILNPAAVSAWRSLPQDIWYLNRRDTASHPLFREGYGIAVDMGTTNISIALFSYTTGTLMTIHTGANPQSRFGYDVISRLDAAIESADQAQTLEQLAVDTIAEGMLDIAAREGAALDQVRRIVIVGNTAMLSLLCNDAQANVIDPACWDRHVALKCHQADRWKQQWGVGREASVVVIPPIAGFIGSDLLAGIELTQIAHLDAPSLLVDFGTNSEIALAAHARTWITAASGGPAFEGMGIKCGMQAVKGAVRDAHCIHRGEWRFDVIESRVPAGICGSGLISLISELQTHDLLKSSGNFTDGTFKWELPRTGLYITKSDIDKIQRAKASVASGIEVLCNHAGIHTDAIESVFVSGAFGWYLDHQKARSIGLLPEVNKILPVGNSALGGAIKALYSDESLKRLLEPNRDITMINLSKIDDFESIYLNNLYLAPIGQRR